MHPTHAYLLVMVGTVLWEARVFCSLAPCAIALASYALITNYPLTDHVAKHLTSILEEREREQQQSTAITGEDGKEEEGGEGRGDDGDRDPLLDDAIGAEVDSMEAGVAKPLCEDLTRICVARQRKSAKRRDSVSPARPNNNNDDDDGKDKGRMNENERSGDGEGHHPLPRSPPKPLVPFKEVPEEKEEVKEGKREGEGGEGASTLNKEAILFMHHFSAKEVRALDQGRETAIGEIYCGM